MHRSHHSSFSRIVINVNIDKVDNLVLSRNNNYIVMELNNFYGLEKVKIGFVMGTF